MLYISTCLLQCYQICKKHELEKIDDTEYGIRNSNAFHTPGKSSGYSEKDPSGLPMRPCLQASEANPAGRTGRAGLAADPGNESLSPGEGTTLAGCSVS